MNNLADEYLANIIVILTPLEAMSARCTCRTFRCIYDDVHCSLNISTDLETTLLQIRDGGTIQLASDAHIIAKKDIVIRKNIRILGNQNSKICLTDGARIILCSVGVLTDMRIERDQTDIECFPDAAVSVRGLGRLHMRRCTVQYIYPSTFTPVNSKTFGVHIDFGGVARLHDSKFFDTPGPCIKGV